MRRYSLGHCADFQFIFSECDKHRQECFERVDVYKQIPLSQEDLERELMIVDRDCYETFIGYLAQVITELSNVLGVETNELLDYAVGGVTIPTDFPIRCIANELTSIYPNLMTAHLDVTHRVDSILHPQDH